ncbi:ABC transporter permease [Desulforhopalus singaporensis]|uniref:Putative ABC transport system permease protein n=1 Tax=Desulforhopalus singaporensis TaxID=91360 RepID=A0A1H0M036_9BACT|nr:FtsX-like permease family protein [Desulforhopalus singaporensis]SDO73745.1 putative ABC transport system permease protein [Desulforhopalus singaporensis]
MHLRYIYREIINSRGQAAVYILCVALSLVTIVAIDSFRRDIDTSLLSDAKNLLGGDIRVRSHRSFSPELTKQLAQLAKEPGIEATRSWELNTVVRRADGGASVLASLMAVEPNYPLYGEVKLISRKPMGSRLKPGSAVVQESLLKRLGGQVGDRVLVGNGDFGVVDLVERESARPLSFFNFAPRIFVSATELERLGLVGLGSRVHHQMLLKLSGGRLQDKGRFEQLVTSLEKAAKQGGEQVDTYLTAQSRMKRFLDNLLFFLSLISVFTLLLAGIGVERGLNALFSRKKNTFAMIRSMGASTGFVVGHYLVFTLFLTVAGCLLGIVLALSVKQVLPVMFSGLLPDNLSMRMALSDIVEGVWLGLLVAALFTYGPLRAVVDVRPATLFRHERRVPINKYKTFLVLLCGAAVVLGSLVRQLDDFKTGLYFLTGAACLIIVMSLLVTIVMKLLPAGHRLPLSYRQAVRSLNRPGGSTRTIMVAFGASLAVLLTIELVERNMHDTYISSYPPGSPNLFCLDIQKNQRSQFRELIGARVELFPVVRARLLAINGVEVDLSEERKRKGDRLSREFNLTYREKLLQDEILVSGKTLFYKATAPDSSPLAQVSVLDRVATMGNMKTGDVLTFNVQGVRLKAKISSIRSRNASMLYPFFYFVFEKKQLEEAPQTFFAALSLPVDTIGQVENRIVNALPNVITVNVSETASELGNIIEKMVRIIDFFAIFSIGAGSLILVSSYLATRMARVREAVYYKVLGGDSLFVSKVFILENLILALGSGCCGILVAQAASFSICYFMLDISYSSCWERSAVALLFLVLLVLGVGTATLRSVIREKPARFLRNSF